MIGGFPGDPVVGNLPCNGGDTGSIPGLEDPTCWGATKPLCDNCWSLCHLEPRLPSKWSHCSEKLGHHNKEARSTQPEKALPIAVMTEHNPKKTEVYLVLATLDLWVKYLLCYNPLHLCSIYQQYLKIKDMKIWQQALTQKMKLLISPILKILTPLKLLHS